MGNNLAARAAAQRTETAQQAPTLADQIQTMVARMIERQEDFQAAMPRGIEATQLIRDALTSMRATPKLAQCHAPSVLGGLMTCAQLGLRPGVAGLGHAWLLPMWNTKDGRLDAQLIIGYRGYVELGYRHERVASIQSRIVYSNDRFDLSYGLEGDELIHKPQLDGPRGEPRLYYALARFRGGGYALTDPMTQADMEAWRDKYAMAKTKDGKLVGPWSDPNSFPEMGRKTMIRARLVKMMPITTEMAQAITVDEGVRVDISPTADPAEVTERPVIDGHVEQNSIEGPDGPPADDSGWPEVVKPGTGARPAAPREAMAGEAS